MQSRRNFLQLSSLGLPILASANPWSRKKGKKPIVVATWDSGIPVAAEAWEVLKDKSGTALDAVEAGAISIENEISCCVGLGGNPDRDGIVTLDACIMDHKFNCGAVAGLERIKNPISVARKVMEDTPHVMFVGAGAQQFALENGFPLESGELSETAKDAYANWLKKEDYKPIINIEQSQLKGKKLKMGKGGNGPSAPSIFEDGSYNHDTMGLIALDHLGRLAGACTTSVMGFKMRGRVGDSPIIGSGLYVDPQAGAVVATGQGEEIIRTSGCHLVSEYMRQGKSPQKACKMAIERIVRINPAKARNFQACYIAISRKGEYGAYAIQPGFSFAVQDEDGSRLVKCESYL